MRLIFSGKNSARMEIFMRMKWQDGRGRENQLLAHIKKTYSRHFTDLFLHSGTEIYNHAKMGLLETKGIQCGIPRSCL